MDTRKEQENLQKHGVSFFDAQYAFSDLKRVIAKDKTHSTAQGTRYFCFGCVDDGVLTVRFTYRRKKIRIFGAGYWREGRKIYERKTKVS